MVDVKRFLDEDGWVNYSVKTPKTKASYKVVKTLNGFSSYHIEVDTGKVPKDLEGSYTTPDKALKHLVGFLEARKATDFVNRDIKSKRSQEWKRQQNASKSKPDNQSEVQQGTSD